MAGGFSGYQDFGQHTSIEDIKRFKKYIYISRKCAEAMAAAVKEKPLEINPAMIFGQSMPDGSLKITDFVSGCPAVQMITARPPHEHMFEDAQRWYEGARHVMRERFSAVQVGWWIHSHHPVFDWADVREYEQHDFLEHPYYSLEFGAGTTEPPIAILKSIETGGRLLRVAHLFNPRTGRYEAVTIGGQIDD